MRGKGWRGSVPWYFKSKDLSRRSMGKRIEGVEKPTGKT